MKPAKEVVNELLFGGRTIFGTPAEVHERRAKRLEKDRIEAQAELRAALRALGMLVEHIATDLELQGYTEWPAKVRTAEAYINALRLLDEPES